MQNSDFAMPYFNWKTVVMLPNRSHWKILQRTEDDHGDTGIKHALRSYYCGWHW